MEIHQSPWVKQPDLQVIGEALGSGAFGKVWKALHSVDKTYYAIKQVFIANSLSHYGGNVQKLLEEVNCLKEINSIHVVKYHNCWLEGPDIFHLMTDPPNIEPLLRNDDDVTSTTQPPPEENFLFIQMELCNSTLKDFLKNEPTVRARSLSCDILNLLIQLSEALKVIHEYNIIHRDLKPDNIFKKECHTNDAQKNGGASIKCIWKIGDFGLSRKFPKDNNTSQNFLASSIGGCAHYRSPEMESLEYCKKTDVFSMGLVFLEILHPFATDKTKWETFVDIRSVGFEKIKQRFTFGDYARVEEILEKMLHTNPTERLDALQVKEMLNALKNQPSKNLHIKGQNSNTSNGIKSNLTPNAKRPIRFEIRPPVSTFTGRRQELITICKLFKNQEPTNMRNIVIIEGLGGIGKTNLARKFADAFFKEYCGDVIWIGAENALTLKRSFDALLEKLKIPCLSEKLSETLNTFYDIFQETNFQQSKQKRKDRSKTSASNQPSHLLTKGIPAPSTLIIFDNVEVLKSDHKLDNPFPEVFDYIPHSHDFYTEDYIIPYFIITTRKKDLISNCQKLKLTPLRKDEAVQFVKNVLEIPDGDSREEDVSILCEVLQNFPLALQQAVAYIKENEGQNYTIKSYVQDFSTKKAKLLLGHEFTNSTDDNYQLTTLITWNMSLEKIKSIDNIGIKAMEVMHIIAYMPADNIPCKFIKAMIIDIEDDPQSHPDMSLVVLNLPQKYSMYNISQNKISVHRLVQKVIQLSLADLGTEIQFLKKLFKGVLKFLSHVLYIEQQLEDSINSVEVADFLIHWSNRNMTWENYLDEAVPCIMSLWAHGFKHKELIKEFYTSPFELAEHALTKSQSTDSRWYHKLNKPLVLQSLEMILEGFDDQPECQLQLCDDFKNKLLTTQRKTRLCFGMPMKEKKVVFQKLFEFYLKVLGRDHSNTVECLLIYVELLQSTPHNETDLVKSRQLLEDECLRTLNTLGPLHDTTFKRKSELAWIARYFTNIDEGIRLYREILADKRRLFGVNHKECLKTMQDLAYLCEKGNNHIEYIAICESIFKYEKQFILEKISMGEPVLCGFSENSFAMVRKLKVFFNQVERAVAILQEIYEIQLKFLGTIDNPRDACSEYTLKHTWDLLQISKQSLFHQELLCAFSTCKLCIHHDIKCVHTNTFYCNSKARKIVQKLQATPLK